MYLNESNHVNMLKFIFKNTNQFYLHIFNNPLLYINVVSYSKYYFTLYVIVN